MYCKPTASDMADGSKKSFALGFGIGIGRLGCKSGTTEGMVG